MIRRGWVGRAGAALMLPGLMLPGPMLPGLASAAPSSPPDASALRVAEANRESWGIDQAALSLSNEGSGGNLFLTGNPPLPGPAQAQIDAMRITREPMPQLVAVMQAQNKAANALTDPTQRQAAKQAWQQDMSELAREAATRSLLRDLYSPAQLQEQMTWFWFNHFNVHAQKREIRAVVGDYEDSLRSHALGRFRDLLEASLRHPAMLEYLDNDQNAAGKINENYAREIMELHTLGLGSGGSGSGGAGAVYSQKDVQELARILTGVGVRIQPDTPRLRPDLQPLYVRDGIFEFNPQRHDFGDKVFLGHTIHGSGFGEVEQALDLIAASPATARHVSGQIATYFMGASDQNGGVPPALVARMAAAWMRSSGDIPTVLRTLFASPEYHASLGSDPRKMGFKDPVHYVVSAVRLAYNGGDGFPGGGPTGGRVILNADPMINWLRRMGEGLYDHETPDGYPMSAAAWTGPGQMEARFEIARAIGNGSAGLFRPRGDNASDQPAFPQLQNALYYTALAGTLGPQTRAALDQATSPQEWNMLFLASPDFMRR